MRQEQDGGDRSINNQAGRDINQNGLSLDQLTELKKHVDDDVVREVELAVNRQMDSIRSDFVRFTGEAHTQAMAMAQHLVTTLIEQLASRAPQNIASTKTPAMQQSILNACTSAAVADDDELTQTLVDILIDKSGAEPRSFKGVVLNEALEVAGKLTADQVNLLTALVVITCTVVHSLDSVDSVLAEINHRCEPLYGRIPTTTAALQYMAYTGVGALAPLNPGSMAAALAQIYDGIFTQGFTAEQLPDEMRTISLDLPKVDGRILTHEDARLRFPAASSQSFDKAESDGTLNEPYLTHKEAAKNLITNARLPVEKFVEVMESGQPNLAKFFRDLDKLNAVSFTLTSVGIAIGQANWRRLQPTTVPSVDIYLA